MISVDWNALVRHIDRSLPGLCLWMQCVPVRDDDSATEEGVGLALQRLSEPDGRRRYLVVFFSIFPSSDATDERSQFLPGRGERTDDWTIEVGYEGAFDLLEEAIHETKSLARDLPMSGIYRTHERREAILDEVADPDDDLGQTARYER